MTVLRAALPVLALLAAPGAAAMAQDQALPFRLEEAAAYVLPDSFALAGASLSPSGMVVIWSTDGPPLLLGRDGALSRVDDPPVRHPLAVAFVEGDSVLEAVDARTGEIVRFPARGGPFSRRPLGLAWEAESAVRTGRGWVTCGRDAGGILRLMLHEPGTGLRVLNGSGGFPGDGAGCGAVHLSDGGDGVIVTQVDAPFTTLRAGYDGTAASLLADSPAGEPLGSGGPPLWISLPVLALDSGFLRTFADLRSDRRLLARYDGEGHLARRAVLDVPLGFLATVPAQRLAVGVRRVEGMEVVVYAWRWDTP